MAVWEWGKYLGEEANGARHGRVRFELESHCAEHAARALQGRRKLHELAVDPDGVAPLTDTPKASRSIRAGLSAKDRVRTFSSCATERSLRRRSEAVFCLGITRDSVIQLAQGLGIPVTEALVPRESLYIADEVFFVGTAAEVTPIRSVDRIPVGQGRRGPITEKLQKEFFAIVEGRSPDKFGWLTPVAQPVASR